MARTDYYGIQTPVLQATSQAIRTVNGTVGTIAPEDYPDLISAMKSGTDYDNVMAQLVEETTTPAAIASFTDGSNGLPVKELVCTINPTETGSGAKSPSNPYVIGGHTGINITRTGKNQFDISNQTEKAYIDSTGEITIGDPGWNLSDFQPVKPNTVYHFNPNTTTGGTAKHGYYDKDKNFISAIASGEQTFTTPNNACYMRFSYRSTSTDIMLNFGSTALPYEPYSATTHTAAFGQTVYGGELNVTTGVLTVTHKIVNLGNYVWQYRTNYGSKFFSTAQLNDYGKNPVDFLCDTLSFSGYYTDAQAVAANIPNNSICAYKNDSYPNSYSAYVRVDSITDITTFNNFISNVNLVYMIKEPFTIQLTPIEVRTLLGSNNIYHDCNGNTEVTYRANGALYVAQH